MDRCAAGKHGSACRFPAHGDVVVYAALAGVRPDAWVATHGRHSRRITPLVALVYGAALVCCIGVLINSGGNSTTQLAGMVIAIEPMVNAGGPQTRLLDDGWSVVTADGSLSAHFEHTIAITENGPEIFTLP